MAGQRQIMAARDIALACSLLSRLPIPVDPDFAARRGAAAAWAYPLAGGLVAVIAGLAGWLVLSAGMPAAIVAGLVLAIQVIVTGAMHEDGLADAADGLWGGWTRERRLEIMKDSRIGTYGVLALTLAIGLRWSGLTALGAVMFPALVAAALLSRAVMVVLMAALPHARTNGLSHSVGRPGLPTAAIAACLAVALSAPLVGPAVLTLSLVAALTGLACAGIARVKIGGQTGDILGATQQLCEISLLAVATLLLI